VGGCPPDGRRSKGGSAIEVWARAREREIG
jgi:hypothetical protein